MPFYLKDRDVFRELAGVRSVLIVPCDFCPAASLAVREERPFIDLFHSFLKTPVYEDYIQGLQSRLKGVGIRTAVYHSRMPVVCMWPAGLREDLARQAADYDALIVLGCAAAVETARQCVKSTACRVIAGMEAEGIMNVIPTYHFPGKVFLEQSSVIRLLQQEGPELGDYGAIYQRMEQALEECCVKFGDRSDTHMMD